MCACPWKNDETMERNNTRARGWPKLVAPSCALVLEHAREHFAVARKGDKRKMGLHVKPDGPTAASVPHNQSCPFAARVQLETCAIMRRTTPAQYIVPNVQKYSTDIKNLPAMSHGCLQSLLHVHRGSRCISASIGPGCLASYIPASCNAL